MTDITTNGKRLHTTLIKTPRMELAFISGVTEKSFTVDAVAALAHKIVFEMPSFPGAVVTGQVVIENSDGKEIYRSTACAENDTYTFALDPPEPLVGENTVKVVLDTDPLSSGSCYIALYLRGDN